MCIYCVTPFSRHICPNCRSTDSAAGNCQRCGRARLVATLRAPDLSRPAQVAAFARDTLPRAVKRLAILSEGSAQYESVLAELAQISGQSVETISEMAAKEREGQDTARRFGVTDMETGTPIEASKSSTPRVNKPRPMTAPPRVSPNTLLARAKREARVREKESRRKAVHS